MTRARENADGGLVFIGTANPSASAGVSFTNLTVGKRYRLEANLYGSAVVDLYFRFRENSTDKTSTYYQGGIRVNEAGTNVSVSLNNSGYLNLISLQDTALHNSLSFDIHFITGSHASINGTMYNNRTTSAAFMGGYNASMTAVNGFSLFPSSGTMTGNIKLYEYR